jgi:hypothetical protein
MSNQVEETLVFRKIKKDKYEETAEIYEELDYLSEPVETFQISEIKSTNNLNVRCALTVCVVSIGVFFILTAMVWALTATVFASPKEGKVRVGRWVLWGIILTPTFAKIYLVETLTNTTTTTTAGLPVNI